MPTTKSSIAGTNFADQMSAKIHQGQPKRYNWRTQTNSHFSKSNQVSRVPYPLLRILYPIFIGFASKKPRLSGHNSLIVLHQTNTQACRLSCDYSTNSVPREHYLINKFLHLACWTLQQGLTEAASKFGQILRNFKFVVNIFSFLAVPPLQLFLCSCLKHSTHHPVSFLQVTLLYITRWKRVCF